MVAHVWNHGTVEDVVGEYNTELHSKMTVLNKQTSYKRSESLFTKFLVIIW